MPSSFVDRHDLGQEPETTLRCAVRGGIGARDVLVHGGEVDYPTAVPAGVDHPPGLPLGTQECPRQIGVYDLLPLLVGELQELARLQSEQSSSRVPSESSPSQNSPAFLLLLPEVLGGLDLGCAELRVYGVLPSSSPSLTALLPCVQTLLWGVRRVRRAEGMRRVVLVLATMALATLLAGGVAQAIINGDPDRGPNAHPYVGALVSVPASGEFKGQRIPRRCYTILPGRSA
jgi:hypothetical protein